MKRIVALSLLFVLLISPLAALAQDDEETVFTEWESEDGSISISHPEDWFVAFSWEYGGLLVVNQETLLETATNPDETLQSGEFGVLVLLFPPDLMAVDLTSDALPTPQDFVDFMVQDFAANDTVEGEIRTAEVIELDDERDAALVEIAEDTVDSLFVVFIQDEVGILVNAGTAPGEMDDLRDIALEMAASFQFDGTLDDWNALLTDSLE